MTKGTKERNHYMHDFCRFVCPDFLNRKKQEIVIGAIVNHLTRYQGLDIKKLYHQGCEFVSKNPEGVVIEEDMSRRGKGTRVYIEKASRLIIKHTKINIPAVNILSTFYESIMNNCLISSKQQQNKGLCLVDLIE